MATWPDLNALNGGQQFTAADAVTPDVFNCIVASLKAASAPTPSASHYVVITSDYVSTSSGILVAEAGYSIDNGGHWRTIPVQGTLTVYTAQIKFYVRRYVSGPALRIMSPTLHLNISRSSHGVTYSDNLTIAEDITDVNVQ